MTKQLTLLTQFEAGKRRVYLRNKNLGNSRFAAAKKEEEILIKEKKSKDKRCRIKILLNLIF